LDNFQFALDPNDTIFVLTYNKSSYKENVGNIISKMIVINELKYVNLDNFIEMLTGIGINQLSIFSINNEFDDSLKLLTNNKNSKIQYIEVNHKSFNNFINSDYADFFDYNKDSLYIVRGGNYIDIKNLFATINNCQFNLGRGGSQKQHMLSPLDFRLSCYMMAMFNFDYKLISSLNTFNYIGKDRYLSWIDRSSIFSGIRKSTLKTPKEFKSIYVNDMPTYSKDEHLGQYNLECREIKTSYGGRD